MIPTHRRSSSRGRVFATALAAGMLLVACSSRPDEPLEATRSSSAAIIDGNDSASGRQDSVVLVLRYDGGRASSLGGCTGTLLTPRLVLTARHCVATTELSSICGSDGAAVEGGAIYGNVAASSLYVFSGNTRPDLLDENEVVVRRGVEIFDDGATTICNHDLALVLLDGDVEGADIAPVRLRGNAVPGEELTAVGWGVTEREAVPATRQQRESLSVLAVGPEGQLGLSSAEFLMGEGGCEGDSGGPLFTASGAVIGVLSRGGNGEDEDVPEACIGAQNVYTSTAGFADVIRRAGERAGQALWVEGGRDPRLPPETEDSGCHVAPNPVSTPSGRVPAGLAFLGLAMMLILARRARP